MADWDVPALPCRSCGRNTERPEVGACQLVMNSTHKTPRQAMLFCASCASKVIELLEKKFSKDREKRRKEYERDAPVETTYYEDPAPLSLGDGVVDVDYTEE